MHLTYSNKDAHTEPATTAKADEAGAPEEDEIVITDEMLRAGADRFFDYKDLHFGTARTAAFSIFKAMILASKQFHHCQVFEEED
jgi:hypothetical protein